SGGGITAILSARLPVRLGDLSYSWYLWHWPAIVFASVLFPNRNLAVLAGFASIGLAWLSYVYVEEWFRHDDRWQGWWSVALAVGCIALPVVAMGALWEGADRLWGLDTVDEVAAFNQLHGDVVRGCDETQGATWDRQRCTWSVDDATDRSTAAGQSTAADQTDPDDGSTPTAPAGPVADGQADRRSDGARPAILLLGDSHAGHLTEAVTGAGNSLGYDVIVRTQSACPFVRTELVYLNGAPSDSCRAYVESSLQQVMETKPAAVVVSTAIREYLTENSIVLGPDPERFDRSQADRLDVWQHGFEAALAELDRAGVNVLVVQPLPVFEDWSLLRCSMITVATSPGSCGTSAPRDELLEARAVFAQSNESSAGGFARVTTIDLFDGLCPDRSCVTNDGETFSYRDGDHLTVDRSAALAPRFAEALASLDTR
ncbi:MAG: acyltransferase family protein, partial [Acidimicrobiales bacterium]